MCDLSAASIIASRKRLYDTFGAAIEQHGSEALCQEDKVWWKSLGTHVLSQLMMAGRRHADGFVMALPCSNQPLLATFCAERAGKSTTCWWHEPAACTRCRRALGRKTGLSCHAHAAGAAARAVLQHSRHAPTSSASLKFRHAADGLRGALAQIAAQQEPTISAAAIFDVLIAMRARNLLFANTRRTHT